METELKLRIRDNMGERYDVGVLDYDYLGTVDKRNNTAQAIILELLNQCPDGAMMLNTLQVKLGAPKQKFRSALKQLQNNGIVLIAGDKVTFLDKFRKYNSDGNGLNLWTMSKVITEEEPDLDGHDDGKDEPATDEEADDILNAKPTEE